MSDQPELTRERLEAALRWLSPLVAVHRTAQPISDEAAERRDALVTLQALVAWALAMKPASDEEIAQALTGSSDWPNDFDGGWRAAEARLLPFADTPAGAPARDEAAASEGDLKIIAGVFSVANGELSFTCTTQGVTFSEVLDGLTKLRDEIDRQIRERGNCPYKDATRTDASASEANAAWQPPQLKGELVRWQEPVGGDWSAVDAKGMEWLWLDGKEVGEREGHWAKYASSDASRRLAERLAAVEAEVAAAVPLDAHKKAVEASFFDGWWRRENSSAIPRSPADDWMTSNTRADLNERERGRASR